MRILALIIILLVIVCLGRMFNPLSGTMFDFHDETQPARISEFTTNLTQLRLPPRLAPHFSHNMGFPVFNFYAPSAYWITSFINLLGFDVANSIKLSFLLAILIGFAGMFFFLKLFFHKEVALLGASLFMAAPWIAVEIFVRGNLGEVWFISSIPWVFYFLYRNSLEDSKYIFIGSVVTLMFSLTAHNVLSLIFLPWVIITIIIFKKSKKNFFALLLALLTSSYFFIPAILEISLTQAAALAKGTNYRDHFLCLDQIWTAPFWGYGGSAPGCKSDGFSFMLGKIQLLLALGGSLLLFYDLYKKRLKNARLWLVIFVLTVSSIFLTLYHSAFIWMILSPIFSLFQFPWRFLALAVFGNAVLGAYLFSRLKIKFAQYLVFGLAIVVIIFGAKYFTKSQISKQEFNNRYLSGDYIEYSAAYAIQEYLPKDVDYQTWLKLKGVSSDKIASSSTKINLHYFPFWKIYVNGQQVTPTSFDLLGRPLIPITKPSIIHIEYSQTNVEKMANAISLLTIIYLILILGYKPLWPKTKKLIS